MKSKYKARYITFQFKDGNSFRTLEAQIFKSTDGSIDGATLSLDGQWKEVEQHTVCVSSYYPTILISESDVKN